jgi:hypothetical protein
MFYLADVPLEKWLKKYPELRDEEPLCDCTNPNVVPFRMKGCVGITCRKCNTGSWIPATAEENLRRLRLFFGALRGMACENLE